MLAFTRKPANDESPDGNELLLADADDDLAPLTTNTPATPAPVEPSISLRDSGSMRLVVAPRWTPLEREAYASLLEMVAAREPRLGWRHVLFVVSGICLVPSRSERVLRSRIATLASSVDPVILDDDKEAAS